MIWIDSSFAIDWLQGQEAARDKIDLTEKIGILPHQFAEILVFFKRRDPNFDSSPLEMLDLATPNEEDLKLASNLYINARKLKSKASLADAMLAAKAKNQMEKILTFDNDFLNLGFMEESQGIWKP
jgi:predicted nucleic acid-binding protein